MSGERGCVQLRPRASGDDTYWPDFGREDIDLALAEYGRRKRKFGRLLPSDEKRVP